MTDATHEPEELHKRAWANTALGELLEPSATAEDTELGDEIGVAPPQLHFFEEGLARGVRSQCAAIRPVRRQRVIDVDHAHDLRKQRDCVASEAVWISAAVQPFVMRPHD